MYIRSIDRYENKVEIELQDADFTEGKISKDIFIKEMINDDISKDSFFKKYQHFLDNIIDRSFSTIFGDDGIYTAAFGVGECDNKVVIDIYYREGIDEHILDVKDTDDYLSYKRNMYVVSVPRLENVEKILDLLTNMEISSSTLSKDIDTYYLTIITPKKINIDSIFLTARIREFADIVEKRKGIPLIKEDAVEKLRIVFRKE